MAVKRGSTRASAGDFIAGLRSPASRRARAALVNITTRPLIRAGVADAGGLRRGDGRKKYLKRPARPRPPSPPVGRARRKGVTYPSIAKLAKRLGR